MKRFALVITVVFAVCMLFACAADKSQNTVPVNSSSQQKNDVVDTFSEEEGTVNDIPVQTDAADKNESENIDEEDNVLFSTNYNVHDYFDGIFIVSNSAMNLYGALDINGEVLVPIKYDEVSFIKFDTATNDQNVTYIQTRYENECSLYSPEGKLLCQFPYGNEYGSIIDTCGEYFIFYAENPYRESLVTVNGQVMITDISCAEFTSNGSVGGLEFINKEDYLSGRSDKLYVDGWAYTSFSDPGIKTVYTIENGKLIESVPYDGAGLDKYRSGIVDEVEDPLISNSTLNELNNNSDVEIITYGDSVVLYESNSTFKLIDLDTGENIGEDRYFKCYEVDKTSLRVLETADGNYCLLNSKAEMMLNIGEIDITKPDAWNSVHLIINGIPVDEGSSYEGTDTVVLVAESASSDMKWDIYYFDGQ